MKKNRSMKDEDINDINPYEVDKFSKVPSGLILTFSKFWAAAAAVFFILIGGIDIGIDFTKPLEDGIAEMARTVVAIVMVSLFLAILMNYGVKHLAYLMLNRRNNTKKWMTLNFKGFLGFLAYLVYSLVCVIVLFFIISFLSMKKLIPSILDNNGSGIEPFSFGFLYILVDGVFLCIKNGIVYLYQRLHYKAQLKAVTA